MERIQMSSHIFFRRKKLVGLYDTKPETTDDEKWENSWNGV